MLRVKKLTYVFSLAGIVAAGCCFPALPLCNECVFGWINALATLAGISNGTAV